MNTLAGIVLALLAVALLHAIAAGKGLQWLRAKFLGQGA